MNVHVSKEIQDRWPQFEFRGIPRTSKHGFIYLEAYYKVLNQTLCYVFGADSFVEREGIKCGAPELIFDEKI